jgi:chemotaxis protein CheX
MTHSDTSAASTPSFALKIDQQLLEAVISSTFAGLEMTNIKPIPVGASRFATARHPITVMVGLVGRHSGNMTINISEAAMLHLTGALMGETFTRVTEDTIDAMMELGNMVAGSIKMPLAGTGFEISHISLPSLILGNSYDMVYARGISSVAVDFEIPGMPFSTMNGRFFSSAVSLLRAAGSTG